MVEWFCDKPTLVANNITAVCKFYFGKNACSFWHTVVLFVPRLVAKLSYAFFGCVAPAIHLFLLGGMKVELYQPFHELFSTVGETTNQLLKLCQDDEMRKLLLRQQEAVAKALKDYCEILNKKA